MYDFNLKGGKFKCNRTTPALFIRISVVLIDDERGTFFLPAVRILKNYIFYSLGHLINLGHDDSQNPEIRYYRPLF